MTDDDQREPYVPVPIVAYCFGREESVPRFAYSTFKPERDTPRIVPPYDLPSDDSKSV